MPLTLAIDTIQEAVNSQTGVSGTIDLDISSYGIFYIEANNDVSINFNNPSTDPQGNSIVVFINNTSGGPISLTWNDTVLWTEGVSGVAPSAGTQSLFSFISRNGGTEWIGMTAAEDAE